MPDLRYSFKEFQAALDERKLLRLTASGEWFLLGWFRRIFFSKFYLHQNARAFAKFLDEQEREPVKFPLPMSSQECDVFQAGDALLRCHFDIGLARRLVAYRYRLEAMNGGLSPEVPSLQESARLKEEAAHWKGDRKFFWKGALSAGEGLQIEVAAGYKAFAALLYKSEKLKNLFFEWVIRDGLPASVFIEFPWVCQTLEEHLLTGRIGTVGGDKLKIQKIMKDRSRIKVVTLPFEGKEISLLDLKHQVHFRGDVTLTIEEIFKLFKEKPRRFVDVEYFAHGVSNWNAQHLGYWVPAQRRYESISVEQSEWWRQLPPLDVISWGEAKARYGSWVNGINWVACAKASRHYLNLNYERCHAYLEIAIPSKDGSYFVYDFGKFARLFPYGVVDNMRMFTITTAATIAYPDENIYHTKRQRVGYAFELNHYQGLLLMEEIRIDILRARAGNMVFQIEAENCGHWIQTHMEELLGKEQVPNLFRVKLLKSDAQGFVGTFFKFLRLLPTIYQVKALALFHYTFGAWRGQYVTDRNGERVFKSLSRTSFWKDIIVYMPALLHKQYERGYISPNVPFDELDEAIEKTNSNILILEKKASQASRRAFH